MYSVAIGGIVHETHTFAPTRTDLQSFARQSLYEGAALTENMRGTQTPPGGALAALERASYSPVPLLYAAAMPSGIITHEAYAELTDHFLKRLAHAIPVDGVLLNLHGAMVAEGVDDCEGDLLQRVRLMVGAQCPIVSTLDMHGNLSPAMVESTDALVAFNTNPHLDTFERGLEAGQILQRLLEEKIIPTRALARPPLLLSALATRTDKPPLASVHQRAREMKRDPRVLNISVMGGFAYADTPFTGMSVCVTTNGEPELARELADELAWIAWQEREVARYVGLPIKEAVALAMTFPKGPVVLADVADNIGGGSPGDGTALLRELLRAKAPRAVVVIADAAAVARCAAAGQGAQVRLSVGGKTDNLHGDPVEVSGVVERLTDGRFVNEGINHFSQLYGREVNMGACAVLNIENGTRVLLTTELTPPGDLAQLRSQGIEPKEQQIIIVKSAVAFRGAYGKIAAEIFEVDTPGLVTANLKQFTYHKLPRPIFPLDVIENNVQVIKES